MAVREFMLERSRAMTEKDLEEFVNAVSIASLELFAGDKEVDPKDFECSGRRVIVRLRTPPPSPYGLRPGDLLIVEVVEALRIEGVCRVCGCTDEEGCEGGCQWVEPDLCSQCVPNTASAKAPRLHLPTAAEIDQVGKAR